MSVFLWRTCVTWCLLTTIVALFQICGKLNNKIKPCCVIRELPPCREKSKRSRKKSQERQALNISLMCWNMHVLLQVWFIRSAKSISDYSLIPLTLGRFNHVDEGLGMKILCMSDECNYQQSWNIIHSAMIIKPINDVDSHFIRITFS